MNGDEMIDLSIPVEVMANNGSINWDPSVYIDESGYYSIPVVFGEYELGISVSDDLQGIYELPANFPLLAQGKHKLRVKAGIKDTELMYEDVSLAARTRT